MKRKSKKETRALMSVCRLTGQRIEAFFTGDGVQIKVDVCRRACIFRDKGQYYYRDEAEIWHKPKENTWQSAVKDFQHWLWWFNNPRGEDV